MDDLIKRYDAIGKIKDWMKFIGYSHSERNVMECTIQMLEELPSAESCEKPVEITRLSRDLIDRQDAINAICTWDKFGVDERGRVVRWYEGLEPYVHLRDVVFAIEKLPSVHNTICGYDIDHLMLIAHFLRKENLSPQMVTEVLSDIGHIVTIVTGEYEELLRKTIEQRIGSDE